MKILCLTSRFPYPLEKGDKLRAYHQLRQLARTHEVALFCVNDQPVPEEHLAHMRTFCAHVEVHRIGKGRILLNLLRAWLKGWPFQVGYFYTKAFHHRIRQWISQERPDAIFCQLIRMAEYVRQVRHIPRTLDYMDAYSKGMERRVATERGLKRIAIRAEWRRLLRYEAAVFSDFTAHLIISAQDRELLPMPQRSQVKVIPNGVDFAKYAPLDGGKRHDLMFEGNMAYPPNVESAIFLVRKVMPLVWAQRPDATVVIAGATPVKEVLALAGPRVTVTGWVEDMRQVAAASRISIAPMLISIGMQNKIIQAMAMRMPCIVSALANNAIGAAPGREALVATQPEEYAAHILHLLQHPDAAAAIAEAGHQFVQRHFDWASLSLQIEATLRAK